MQYDDAVATIESHAGSVKTTMSLTEARKLAAPLLATAGSSPAAVPSPAKAARAAPKADVAQGLIPATAVMQLKQAAESCEAVMLKLSSASNAAGLPDLQGSAFCTPCVLPMSILCIFDCCFQNQ